MSNYNIWNKYIKKENISMDSFCKLYKAQNKEIGKYVTIKEIDKGRIRKDFYKEIEIMNKINSENYVKIKETFDSNEAFYIVMDLFNYNLEEYIKLREKPFSINEIREVLIQLNNVFKIMINENIIHRDLTLSNILISLDSIDKCNIKLDYSLRNVLNIINTETSTKAPLTMAPEILKDEETSNKCDLWSLGIIIYYLLFKEYPYNGKNELMLFKDINSGKKLKKCENEELNDLINKMLKININERISWEEYFNHSFFKQNISQKIVKFPKFNFTCKIHDKIIGYYCKDCKINFCKDCFINHCKHEIISFSKIGLTKAESDKLGNIYKEILENFNKLNKTKNDIIFFLNQIKLIKENNSIYEYDSSNNYKKYYIEYLNSINNQIKVIENIKLFELDLNEEEISKENFIIGEYDINKSNLNEEIQILNCFEEAKKKVSWLTGINNEKELIENCELYLNDKKIDFCFKYKFPKEGKYKIKMIFKRFLKTTNYMFYDCNSIISLDLSKFRTNKVTNMKYMFKNCATLSSINLSNFITNEVINMESMFHNCSSLSSLDLSNFNTSNVRDINFMFNKCSSLISLNLSNFDTSNITDMKYMFNECKSLTSIDLSNFNTSKVIDLTYMFSDCKSLISLNLFNFITNNIIAINSIFKGCSSLTHLELSNFNTCNITKMDAMFQTCTSLKSLDLSNFNTHKVIDMSYMFNYCTSLIFLNLSSFNTENVTDMNNMFSHCYSLTSLNLSNFIINKVINMKEMFSDCTSLKLLDLSKFKNKNDICSDNIFTNLNKSCKIIVEDNSILQKFKE